MALYTYIHIRFRLYYSSVHQRLHIFTSVYFYRVFTPTYLHTSIVTMGNSINMIMCLEENNLHTHLFLAYCETFISLRLYWTYVGINAAI